MPSCNKKYKFLYKKCKNFFKKGIEIVLFI